MNIRFLGTGTSQGVPMIACDCAVCQSSDPKNSRFRTHAHVEMNGMNIQIDVAPEFRIQAVRYKIPKVDMVLLTHGHADHILGFDDLRRYCDLRAGDAIPVFSNEDGLQRLAEIFPYAMSDKAQIKGYPAFKPMRMPNVLEIPGIGKVYSTNQSHGRFETLGLVFEEEGSGKRIAYYTDCNSVTEEAEALALGAEVLVVDALRSMPHPSHMNHADALEAASRIGAARTFFTHMTHEKDHETFSLELPANIEPAFDGLCVNV